MTKFFKFKMKRMQEDKELIFNVVLNMDFIFEAHDDFLPNGDKILFLNSSEKREVYKDYEIQKKKPTDKVSTEKRKVVENYSYVVDDPECIERFWEMF